MILELPQDILICVLREWLDVDLKDLSQLDVAVGNRGLREGHWLPLLVDLHLTDQCRLPIANNHASLRWVHDRNLQLKSILVEMTAVNSLDGIALPFTYASVSEVAFDPEDDSTDPFGLKVFLMMFPNVSSIDFSECPLVDDQLLVLLDLPLPRLKKLNLFACDCITSSVVTAVGNKFSSTLESLSCEVLDDAAVRVLTSCCRGLTEIDLSLSAVHSEQSMLELCSQNTNLTAIRLQSFENVVNAMVTNSFVTSISLLCPLLQEIVLDSDDPVDYHVLPALITNCKFLQTIEVGEVELSIHKSVSGVRYCDILKVSPGATDQDVTVVLNALTLPIRRFGNNDIDENDSDEDEDDDESEDENDINVTINRQILHLLANKNGNSLETISCSVSTDVLPEDLQQFLSRCPNLTVLKLFLGDDSTFFDEEAIRRLPLQCPNVVALELGYCIAQVRNQVVVDMLMCFRNNDMTFLSFAGCPSLTDATLDAMDELFPYLREVSVELTSVTKERELDFVVKRRYSPLRSFTAASDQHREWIEWQLAACESQ